MTETNDAPKPGFVDKLKDFVLNKVLGTAWDKLDGYKLYLTGTITLLGGVVGMLTEVNAALATHSPTAIWTLVSHINSDPAYLAVLAGATIIGGAHKADKVIASQQIITNAQDPAPEAGK
jgi:hypothetical protein